AQHIKTDTRKQSKPEEHVELDPQVRLVYKAGGIFIFSAAHLHSTVPNTSGVARYSIDFRTVNLADLKAGIAAPNIDSEPLGTSLRDFVCGDDLSPMPADVVANYDNVVHAEDSVLRFQP
ncbi:MAG TPA: hypothetical protein VEF04_03085, partial [Blastocatellia bacterium]|nr:hypothetical protein [Blastocatellia bacterium]